MPDLGDLISLIGAGASGALALIFPALLEIFSFWHDRRDRKFCWVLPWGVWVVKDLLIVALGVVGFFVGCYISVDGIVHFVKQKDEHCLSLYRH